MEKHKFKEGDVVARIDNPSEGRIIHTIFKNMYFFIDYDTVNDSKFYNPTKSAFGIKLMDKNFHKIGEVENKDELQKTMVKIAQEFTKFFSFTSEQLEKHLVKRDEKR